jgi:hypothetical protein
MKKKEFADTNNLAHLQERVEEGGERREVTGPTPSFFIVYLLQNFNF